ncbi:succinylglutamate desuccinylase/aspartoacylase [Richelia sinica FACHB-800]|uniref:Probable aspartoacylase n=1 Tax=Richelia sinica FACHB-800 TaxID=1357546 RepID=A0A975T8W2_9NOST|nr:aspartoacylase [Richelia sinica]MBD2665772.1 aspartoacylase [Richelia sinica FACHB-800]QXE23588.1 succinylglutamate desuccinylase/aspartoacylase [Richelia sinica FACHB-800]
MNLINRVAIVGGSHGNELIGVFLVKKFQKNVNLIIRSSFQTLSVLGNLKAIQENKRYIDKDLNRCFHAYGLQDNSPSTYEDLRAKEIHQILHPNNQTGVDAIIDLHTTTSNMGISIILSNQHPFLLNLGAYLSTINPLVKICVHEQPKFSGFLRSICNFGIVVEVGAVPQGVLHAELFQQTEQVVYAILDYFQASNQGKTPKTSNILTAYQSINIVDYPRNEVGEIAAMIHPQLQYQDYQPLHPGEPMFVTFNGENIIYKGESTVYPIFINEAAYYEKGIAMHFTQKQEIHL